MRKHINRPGGYFITCPTTGKRGYTTRKQARKARQAGGHRHGNPYKCEHCQLWHLGRYHTAKTRAEYRGDKDAQVHVNQVADELGVSLETLDAICRHLNIPIRNNQVPASTTQRLQQLTYR